MAANSDTESELSSASIESSDFESNSSDLMVDEATNAIIPWRFEPAGRHREVNTDDVDENIDNRLDYREW